MGFLSNLKNKLTGGGAKVSLEIENPNRQNAFNVTVSAAVADSDMEIKMMPRGNVADSVWLLVNLS